MYDYARDNGHTQYMLCVQHRMPAVLAEFISEHVYSGQLQSHPSVSQLQTAVEWVDCKGTVSLRPGSTSSQNSQEADAVKVLMRDLDREWPLGSRVVVTPYSGQRALIEQRSTGSKLHGGNWEVQTVDSFQGREADIVIVSLTRSSGFLRRGVAATVTKKVTAGFIRDIRRSNVMLTRAKKKLFVVGDAAYWRRVDDCAFWRAFAARFAPLIQAADLPADPLAVHAAADPPAALALRGGSCLRGRHFEELHPQTTSSETVRVLCWDVLAQVKKHN